jgi:hypothetical protein
MTGPPEAVTLEIVIHIFWHVVIRTDNELLERTLLLWLASSQQGIHNARQVA